MKLILYHNNLLKFGGVDTFVYNFVKKMSNKFNILFLYTTADQENLKRIKQYVQTEEYNSNKKYICDICLCASAWGQYPESVVSKSGRYIQMVHADYVRAKETGFVYNKWHKTTEHVGVSDHVCKVFKKLYPKEKITRIYNILDYKKETKPILKLISATRVSKEKGYDRMLKLDMDLKNLDIEKIVNKIPKNFKYIEKCNENDWIKILDIKKERKIDMYKIKPKQDYIDKKPELIEKCYGKEIEYDGEGNAKIKKDNVYLVSNKERAIQIKESGLADMEEIKEEAETATIKTKTETAVRKTRKKTK